MMTHKPQFLRVKIYLKIDNGHHKNQENIL